MKINIIKLQNKCDVINKEHEEIVKINNTNTNKILDKEVIVTDYESKLNDLVINKQDLEQQINAYEISIDE